MRLNKIINMKKYKTEIIISLMIVIIAYLGCSFITADLDFRNWPEAARGSYVIMTTLLLIAVLSNQLKEK